MKVIIYDQNDNMLGVNGFMPSPLNLLDIESSRVEGLNVDLSDDAETIILTIQLEEV